MLILYLLHIYIPYTLRTIPYSYTPCIHPCIIYHTPYNIYCHHANAYTKAYRMLTLHMYHIHYRSKTSSESSHVVSINNKLKNNLYNHLYHMRYIIHVYYLKRYKKNIRAWWYLRWRRPRHR